MQSIPDLEVSNSMGSISLLSHVFVHVFESVNPSFELYQVGSMRLDCKVNCRLRLVDHNWESIFRQSWDITQNSSPEQRMTANKNLHFY